MGSAQKLDQPDTWTASNLVALQHMHNELCQEDNCVEGVQDPPADAMTPTLTVRAPTTTAHGQQCLSLFRHLTFLPHSMSRKTRKPASCLRSVVSLRR